MAQRKGKGWFGDSAGHSKAGRKGGLARSQKFNTKTSSNNSTKENESNLSS